MYKTIIIVLVFFSFFSCIRDVTFDEKDSPPEITINCILDTRKDTVTAYISYSSPIQSEHQFVPVKDLKISLYENDSILGYFIWQVSTAYVFPFTANLGERYRIEIKMINKTIWAETTVPQHVAASIEKSSFESDSYSISFIDNTQNSNFYWISASGFMGVEENRHKNIACTIYSNFEYSDDFNRLTYKNGNYKYEFENYIRIYNKKLSDNNSKIIFSPQCISRPIEIFLLSTDYNLDKYMKSSLLMANIDYYAEEVPIAYSPFPVYSNIHGGTGIFGSVTSVSKTFTRE